MRKDAKSFLERLSEPKRQGATSKDISLAQRSEQHLAQVSQAAMFIDRCLDGVDLDADNQAVLQQKLLVFSNSMASATGFEVFELGRSQKSLELAKGTLSLGLEVLANRDAAAGAGILLKESWQKIYQVGTALVDQLRSEAIQMIQSVFPSEADSLREYHDSRSFGKALMWIDQKLNGPLEPQHCDLLKGFFNRFPLAGSLEPQNKQSQANQVEEMQLVGDIEALLELWSDVSCVLLLAQYLAANSSVNLTNMSEALRSTLVLSTRHGEQKTKDWGLSVTQSDLEQWQGLQLADKALKVRKLMASIQNTIPSMDVDESKLALIIGDVLGGSEFSLMKSGECFYAFG
jgi:hypothetical protein